MGLASSDKHFVGVVPLLEAFVTKGCPSELLHEEARDSSRVGKRVTPAATSPLMAVNGQVRSFFIVRYQCMRHTQRRSLLSPIRRLLGCLHPYIMLTSGGRQGRAGAAVLPTDVQGA